MISENSKQGLEQALSLERFGRYLCWADGDRDQAIALCTLNTRISESLYTPLQMLEVVLRNRIHFVMSAHFHEGPLRGGIDVQFLDLDARIIIRDPLADDTASNWKQA